tara:strand:- start:74 stop:598 length:525 start_codon:yes stop_codon:yes gene_type:complete
MVVGRYTYGAQGINVKTWGEPFTLSIGSFCSIAGDVEVFLGGNHRVDWLTTYPFGHIHQDKFNSFSGEGHPYSNGDVVIGNDVWIGRSVTIMSGVTIGNGAVIAARSLVTKDVPPYAIVGGNPSKILRYRFEPQEIEILQKIAWWDLSEEQINDISPILCSSNLEDLLHKLKYE